MKRALFVPARIERMRRSLTPFHHSSIATTSAIRSRLSPLDIDPKSVPEMGLNELQTLLRLAVDREDFDAASLLRDALADRVSSGAYRVGGSSNDEDRRKMKRLSWRGLGTAPWLESRLDALGYRFPTTIQINSFESVNTILGAFRDNNDDHNGPNVITLQELMSMDTANPSPEDDNLTSMGVVISGSTGSGKTLAYLIPMLSTLSDSLFTRQRIRVKAEEDVGDIADDLLARVAIQTSPTLRGDASAGRNRMGDRNSRSVIATGASLTSLGKTGTDVRSPLALIVVPTRELGVQTALLLYELVGGSTKKTATELPGLTNLFKYKGPKGVKIGCVLDAQEAKYGLKLQTDIAITTPQFLTKLLRHGDVDPTKLRVVVYDEADLALEQTTDTDLNALFRDCENDRTFSRLSFLVGATVTESLGQLAVRDSVLPQGKSFIATATRFAPITSSNSSNNNTGINLPPHKKNASEMDEENAPIQNSTVAVASLRDLNMCLDLGLIHERVIAPQDTGLLCLARMLRRELRDYEDRLQESSSSTTIVQRPRVVVFFPGEEEAKAAIEPMRDALWNQHRLCVLLPNIGVDPLRIMEQFKAGDTSVMLATPNSVRGLDFVNLTHVYTLYLPTNDPREYLHLAGRVGRIGQMGSVLGMGGRVTSILHPEEADEMEVLANELNFTFVDIPYLDDGTVRSEMEDGAEVEVDAEVVGSSNVEDARRYLEDIVSLMKLAEDIGMDLDSIDLGDGGDDDDEEDVEPGFGPDDQFGCDI